MHWVDTLLGRNVFALSSLEAKTIVNFIIASLLEVEDYQQSLIHSFIELYRQSLYEIKWRRSSAGFYIIFKT